MREWYRARPGLAAQRVRERRQRDGDAMRAYDRERYATDLEARRKRLARSALIRAVNRGKVQRQPCEVCGAVEVEGHHDDYDRPLEVRWLCPTHHIAEHVA